MRLAFGESEVRSHPRPETRCYVRTGLASVVRWLVVPGSSRPMRPLVFETFEPLLFAQIETTCCSKSAELHRAMPSVEALEEKSYRLLTLARLRYRLVDVFTEVPLRGNPLCVVLDRCPENLMQAIAREVNLSETTFPTQTGDERYEMRIFSPTVELPFAGHPSIGTAWVLGPKRWTQVTSGATVTVEADERGARMTQPPPKFEHVDEHRKEILAALGLPAADGVVRSTAGGTTHVLVATSDPIERLDPNLGRVAAISRACRSHTLVPMRAIDREQVHARVFGPAAGVNEDPGSGSAAGPIGLFARELWGTDQRLVVAMGAEIRRPSRREIDISGEVVVGGHVVASAEGEFLV